MRPIVSMEGSTVLVITAIKTARNALYDEPLSGCCIRDRNETHFIDDMTSAQLEDATTRPFRLLSAMQSEDPKILVDEQIVFNFDNLPRPTTFLDNLSSASSLMWPVPGGRYFVRWSFKGIISVWDMGLFSDDTNAARLICAVERRGHSEIELDIVTADGVSSLFLIER